MATPEYVPVVFENDGLAQSIGDFVSGFTSATQWPANLVQYGVGAASATPVYDVPVAPNQIDDSQVAQLIEQWMLAGALPAPDASTIYVLFFPSSTTITNGVGTTPLCQANASGGVVEGFHDNGALSNGTPVVYAILGRCADLDTLTKFATHEMIEAATDPLYTTSPAYQNVDADHTVWQWWWSGGEVGDMCEIYPDSFYQPSGFAYEVQRTWSNLAATQGHDPCQPALPGEVYFNSAPVLNDVVGIDAGQGTTYTTKGAQVPVGQSKTVEVDLFSDAPTSGPWQVQAVDLGQTPTLNLSLTPTQGQNGDKLQLTVTATAAGQYGGEPFMLKSTLGSATHYWFAWVGN